MRIVTGSNEPYLPKMKPYLDTLRTHCNIPVTFVGVEFQSKPMKPFSVASLTAEQNAGAPERTKCIQHGSFLNVMPGKPDEVLIYTDGDFRMQRPLEQDELDLLTLKHGEVVTSWNGGSQETLTLEATRLGIQTSFEVLGNAWGHDINEMAIYNIGFLAMTRSTWHDVYGAYMRNWERVTATFSHMARQQWLVSYVIQRMGLTVKIAPWSLHAHGHFGMKPGMEWNGKQITVSGRVAAFRHYLYL